MKAECNGNCFLCDFAGDCACCTESRLQRLVADICAPPPEKAATADAAPPRYRTFGPTLVWPDFAGGIQ